MNKSEGLGMTYRRSFMGFSVQNFETGKARKHLPYRGEIVRSAVGELVCRFDQTGEGFRTLIVWHTGADYYTKGLAIIGIDASNDRARDTGEPIVSKQTALKNHHDLNRYAEYGIEVICEDYITDEKCRKCAGHTIFARTSFDNIFQVQGAYSPRDREFWREEFNKNLDGDEDVLEIVNDRYVSTKS
jgi:hypothetical protein